MSGILAFVKQLFRHHGLSIVLLLVFLACWAGQAVAGRADFNNDLAEHGQGRLGIATYLLTSHFWQATAENWESEFLQMGMFVVLTKHLFQKGSAESKDPMAKTLLMKTRTTIGTTSTLPGRSGKADGCWPSISGH